ncbi:MAG: hypothetical protein ABIR24_01300 [Verrucomicrobiota bacterium]
MKKTSRLTKVLSYQSFGFLAIIALCWLNSLLGLPSLILEDRIGVADFRSPVLQMLLILTVWLLVGSSTRRTLDRLKHLEEFMRVCAWCHRVDCKREWMALEKFLEQGLHATASHGICPDCLEKHAESLGGQKARHKIGAREFPTTEPAS